MIDIKGADTKYPRIQFSPRVGFRDKHKPIERDLVYAHYCPYCHNIVQALFHTKLPVNLWPYEETAIVTVSEDADKDGDIRKVMPDRSHGRPYSCYTSTFLGSGQHLALKNHILKFEGLNKAPLNDPGLDSRRQKETDHRKELFESGERCCRYTGMFSLREDLLVKDLCSFAGMPEGDMGDYLLPELSEVLKSSHNGGRLISLPSIGKLVPPVVLVEKSEVIQGFTYLMKDILDPFRDGLQNEEENIEF